DPRVWLGMDPQHPVDIAGLRELVAGSQEVPTNPIITEILEEIRTKSSDIIPTEKLSPTGQAVARNLDESLKDSGRMIETKNRDDLLQKMSLRVSELVRLQSSDVGKNAAQKLFSEPKERLSLTAQILREERLSERLYNLTKLLVTSVKFRELLSETVNILQQLFRGPSDRTKEEGGSYAEAVSKEPEETDAPSETLSREYEGLDADAKRRLFDRFVELITGIQDNKEYQETMNLLLSVVTNIPSYQMSSLEERIEAMNPTEKHVLGEMRENIGIFLRDFKQLLENLANTKIDDAIETFYDVVNQLGNDDEATDMLTRIGDFFSRCFQDKDFVQNSMKSEGEVLMQESRVKLMDKYRPSIEHFVCQLRYYLDRMKRDPLARKLTDDISALTSDLFFDKEGNPTFKPELLMDLQIVVPAILKNLRYIKIPDIEVREPGLEFFATGIVINVGELTPHHLKLALTTDIPEDPSRPTTNKIAFEMSRIHAEAQNIRFAIAKSGIPPLNDTGLADFRIFEDGMRVKLWMQPIVGVNETEKTVKAGLQVYKTRCVLDNFDLNVHGSGHDWMYYLLGPYVRRLVKEKIETAVNNYFLSTDLLTSIPVPEAIASQQSQAQSSQTQQFQTQQSQTQQSQTQPSQSQQSQAQPSQSQQSQPLGAV
ncbi:hypothetical protein PSACC_00279, partial [Paramicrosporidium saccamoebae]